MNFYEEHAKTYFDATVGAEVSESIDKFIYLTAKPGPVLDLGCGSGRDSKKFLGIGYQVVSLDNSAAMAKLASNYLQQKVLVADMEDINYYNHFGGIWAMASLLHLPKSRLPAMISKIHNALKDKGVFFASYKLGFDAGVDANGRFFSYYQALELQKIYSQYFTRLNVFVTPDKLGRTQFQWVNVFAFK